MLNNIEEKYQIFLTQTLPINSHCLCWLYYSMTVLP